MSDKNDKSCQEQLPADLPKRPRLVPFPQRTDANPGQRRLYQAVSGVPAQTISSERTRANTHRHPPSRVPRGNPIAMEPPVNAGPPTYTRPRAPGYSYPPRQALPPSSASPLPARPPMGTFNVPRPHGGRGASASARTSASSRPPPYWQNIGEPSLLCTPLRRINSLMGAGNRATVSLPSVRDVFGPDAYESEDVNLPPIYLTPSVFCHMRDADPASAVDARVGPRHRFRSRSPDSGRSHSRVSETNTDPVPATPASSPVARPAQSRQRPLAPAQPQVQVPGPSAILTEFLIVDVHTAKCDVCNKRNMQGMTRCAECGWQLCNACTVKNNCFRSHRAGVELHVGPVDKKDLPTAASLKKYKTAAKRKREDPDYVPESEKGNKRKRTAKSQVRTTGNASPPSSSPDGSPNDDASVDLSESNTTMDAAQSLYAMSLEAFEMEARARTSKFRKIWGYSLWVENDIDEGDDTELVGTDEEDSDDAGPSSPLTRCIPRLRREALDIAEGESKFYRSHSMNWANASGTDLDERQSESKSESDENKEKVKTRAQTYARKRSGP